MRPGDKYLLDVEKNKLTIHAGKSEVLLITNRNFEGPLRPVNLNEEDIKLLKVLYALE